jgi:hypothetical protein
LINYFNEALDWTVKYRHAWGAGSVRETKIHFGGSFLAGSNFFVLDGGHVSENPYRDYGVGWNLKAFYNRTYRWGGVFSSDLLFYHIFTLSHEVLEASGPDAAVPNVEQGLETCLFFSLAYRHPISDNFYIGLGNTLMAKFGSDDAFTNIALWSTSARLFGEWRF